MNKYCLTIFIILTHMFIAYPYAQAESGIKNLKRDLLITKELDALEASQNQQNEMAMAKEKSWDSVVKRHKDMASSMESNHQAKHKQRMEEREAKELKFNKNNQIKKNPELDKIFKARFQMSTGLRRDELRWSIAGNLNGNSPNILSELTWSDLKMIELKGKGEFTFFDHFVLDGIVAYGNIYKGDNQDSDYLGDNRTLEFSRSNNNSEDGEMWDLTGGFGYKFGWDQPPKFFNIDHLWFTLLGGYSYHEQNLNITDGFQTIPATGGFPNVHSTYETQWKGPWTGFELSGTHERITGFFRMEYHFNDYNGIGNWNLRTDLQHPKSFEHTANGRSFVFRAGGDYKISNDWDLNFNADIQEWEAKEGLDRVFVSDGTILDTRFNEVQWDSASYSLGATYRF